MQSADILVGSHLHITHRQALWDGTMTIHVDLMQHPNITWSGDYRAFIMLIFTWGLAASHQAGMHWSSPILAKCKYNGIASFTQCI